MAPRTPVLMFRKGPSGLSRASLAPWGAGAGGRASTPRQSPRSLLPIFLSGPAQGMGTQESHHHLACRPGPARQGHHLGVGLLDTVAAEGFVYKAGARKMNRSLGKVPKKEAKLGRLALKRLLLNPEPWPGSLGQTGSRAGQAPIGGWPGLLETEPGRESTQQPGC